MDHLGLPSRIQDRLSYVWKFLLLESCLRKFKAHGEQPFVLSLIAGPLLRVETVSRAMVLLRREQDRETKIFLVFSHLLDLMKHQNSFLELLIIKNIGVEKVQMDNVY